MSQTSILAQDVSTFKLSNPDMWDHYIKHRPQYPDSMFAKWLAYHGENEPLETVHDLGTGGGVGALAFLHAINKIRGTGSPPLQTMYLSEPGAANLDAARHHLTPERFPGVTFHFHQGPGEEPNPDIAPRSVDLVMACECLHFTDIEPVMRNVADALRPGGTFAAIMYHAVPRVLHSDGARARQQQFEVAFRAETARRGKALALPNRLQFAMGLDFVPLDDPALWQAGSVVRWSCNVTNRDWPFADLLHELSPEEIAAHQPARRAQLAKDGSGTEREEVVTDRESWGRTQVTVDQMQSTYAAWQPGAVDDFAAWPEWKAFAEEIEKVGGMVDVEVPACMVLAKRK